MPLSSDSTLGLLSFCSWVGKWLLVLVDRLLATIRTRPRVDIYHSLDDGSKAYTAVPGFNLADILRTKVPSLSPGFREAWWLPEGNTQTIYASLGDFSIVDPVVYERKHIQTADGGILTIDITPPLHSHPLREGEIIVAVAHGFTGGSHEHYVRAPLTLLTASVTSGGLGARGVVLNYRGCNGSPVITPRLYHGGSSDDYRTFIAWICHTFPRCKIFGLGFSLGANIAAKYAGEDGADCPLSGLAVLANPWDFVRGSVHIEGGTLINRRLYRNVLGGAAQALYRLHHSILLSSPSPPIEPSRLKYALGRKTISLKEYDDLVTAPMYGFKDATDYYAQISSSEVVENVRIPLLGLNARDDPMVADRTLPLSQVKKNPWVALAVTPGGGHMGWFEQKPDGTIGRWTTKPIKEFFGAILECNLPLPPKPKFIVSDDGWVRQEGRDDVAFTEQDPDNLDLISSGTGESKLFTGW